MALYNYFQSWRIARLSAERDQMTLPPFAPPKPAVEDGLRTLLEVLNTSLATSAFKKSMAKTFVQVSLLKEPKSGEYLKYAGKGKGTIPLVPGGIPREHQTEAGVVTPTFADFAIDVQLEARPPQPQEEDDASWWAKWGGGDVPSSSEESESESESESGDE